MRMFARNRALCPKLGEDSVKAGGSAKQPASDAPRPAVDGRRVLKVARDALGWEDAGRAAAREALAGATP